MTSLLSTAEARESAKSRISTSSKIQGQKAAKILSKFLAGELISGRVFSARGKGCFFCVPAAVRKYNLWKRFTRFLCVADPEKNQIVVMEQDGASVGVSREIVMNSSGALSIPRSTCYEANFDAGDSILIQYVDRKVILTRIEKRLEKENKTKSTDNICNHHISITGDFSFTPSFEIRSKFGWTPETLFSHDVQKGKIVLSESANGKVKIQKVWKLYVNRSLCRLAGLRKGDAIRIEYDNKKIILTKDNG